MNISPPISVTFSESRAETVIWVRATGGCEYEKWSEVLHSDTSCESRDFIASVVLASR